MKNIRKTALFLAVIMTFSCIFTGCEEETKPVEEYNFTWEDNGDTETIRQKISSEKNDEELDISEIMDDFNFSDGSFDGIDYKSTKKDTWHPIKHLQKLLNMQIAVNTPENKFYGDENVKKAVLKGVEYWAEKDYFCDWNGWWNDIGISLYLPDILLYGVEGLSDETKTKLVEKLKANDLFHDTLPIKTQERKVNSTSGNLTDEAISMLKVAVIENDGSTIMWLRSLLSREVRPFPTYDKSMDMNDADGIKEDMSTLMHWHLLYFGGYGEVFTDGMNRYIKYTKDTQYELSREDLDCYSDFILDGMQYAARNGYRDISASGRGAARKNGLKGIYENVKNAAELLLSFDGLKRTEELQNMLDRRFGDKDEGAGGHKFFYEADYNVYNDKNYMATVRHASNRTRIFEVLNDENPLGYYTGLGATFYYNNGDEYYNILPLYDWNKIPGTTTRQGYLPTPDEGKSYNEKGTTDLTAGVSDGFAGASYIKLNTLGVKSNQAYFMFPDGVKCLGSGISSGKKEDIVTGINQTTAGKNITACASGKCTEIIKGTEITGKYDYIHNNGISYITDSEVTVSNRLIDGDWKTINTRMDTTPITGEVFSIYINHGKKPDDAVYDYTVLMNTTPEKTEEYLSSPGLLTIANDKNIQAVYDSENNILEAVFHKKGSVSLPDGTEISVNAPCLIILRNGTELTAASHDFKEHKVKIKVNGEKIKLTVNKKSQTIAL